MRSEWLAKERETMVPWRNAEGKITAWCNISIEQAVAEDRQGIALRAGGCVPVEEAEPVEARR